MTTFSLGSLLIMATQKYWNSELNSNEQERHPLGLHGWLADNKIAVLFHISTPCETYSTNALSKHREKGTAKPKTQEAVNADEMNNRIVAYLRRHAL